MKNYNYKRNYIITLILGFIFIIFTILVMSFDVREIGPKFSSVGFSTINNSFFHATFVNPTMYTLSEILGYLSLLVILYFAVMGLIQLIKRKSFKKVDTTLYILAGFYIIVGIFYLFFNVFVVNYRPVILGEQPEASYPSSHTMLAICVIASALIELKDRIQNKKVYRIVFAVGTIIMFLLIITRLFSGVHWLTDIIGAVLLSSTLVMLYYSTLSLYKTKYLKKGE